MGTDMQMTIVSNNPDVWKKFSRKVIKIDGGPCEVFEKARDMAHKGYHLYCHPVHGNMRLLRNPYRSVVFYEDIKDSPSLESIIFLEESLSRLRRQEFDYTEADLGDYRYLDKDLLERGLPEL